MPAAPYPRLRIVQSRHNARVKELRAALQNPSPERIGLEGLHLVEEALRSRLEVQTIFVREGAESLLDGLGLSAPHADRIDPDAAGTGWVARTPELLCVSAEVLRSAVTTDSPQPIAAIVAPPQFTLEDLFPTAASQPPLVVVLAGLQDPGNVGAILRSAEAFGATGVLALPGTASPWNAKSLRASMGSAFRLPVLSVTVAQAFEALQSRGVLSLAAVAPGHARAHPLSSVDLCTPAALWIGNEGAGLPPELVAACESALTIAYPGPVESLNAAIAAGVLLYEASRQREASRQSTGVPNPAAQKTHPKPR